MALLRDLASSFRYVQLKAPSTAANTDNLSGTESDVGMARRGTLIINITKGTTGLTNIAVYTSETSSFTESTSNRCTMTQDTTNSTGTVTVTTNEIVALDTTGIYIFDVEDLERYVNVEYDGDDADTVYDIVLLAHQLRETPYASARSGY